jgi:hypothetical protein
MGRPRTRTAPTTGGAEIAPKATNKPPVTRRRRPAQPLPDTLAETTTLINAALESRRTQGATTELLQKVVSWARAIREEGEELRIAAGRQRRTRGMLTPERITRHETNRALLEGVLAGRIHIQIEDSGEMLFVHESASIPPAEGSAATGNDPEG